MKTSTDWTVTVLMASALAAVPAAGGNAAEGETTMTETAHGPFDVTMEPAHEQTLEDGNAVARFTMEKQYRGELQAAATGELLTAGTNVEGAAAYVGVEHVEGSLDGRQGTFLLAHKGTMAHGDQQLSITVVPESGTGGLAGLEGEVKIDIAEDGKHFYTFEYAFTERP